MKKIEEYAINLALSCLAVGVVGIAYILLIYSYFDVEIGRFGMWLYGTSLAFMLTSVLIMIILLAAYLIRLKVKS